MSKLYFDGTCIKQDQEMFSKNPESLDTIYILSSTWWTPTNSSCQRSWVTGPLLDNKVFFHKFNKTPIDRDFITVKTNQFIIPSSINQMYNLFRHHHKILMILVLHTLRSQGESPCLYGQTSTNPRDLDLSFRLRLLHVPGEGYMMVFIVSSNVYRFACQNDMTSESITMEKVENCIDITWPFHWRDILPALVILFSCESCNRVFLLQTRRNWQ